MKERKDAIINFIVLIITLIINGMGAVGYINNTTQKEVSDRFVTLITPSPKTFSIWSVIYTLLIISLIVMIIKSKDDEYYKEAVHKISNLFRLSSLFNILWIISFSYIQLEISVVFILGLLISLLLLLEKLLTLNGEKRFLLPITFGMYSGWIFIATMVNISATLVKWDWNGFGIADNIWAMIILSLSVLMVLFVIYKNKNAVFSLPIAWAYLGIYNFLRSADGFNGMYPLLEKFALVGMVLFIVFAIYRFYKNNYRIIPEYR